VHAANNLFKAGLLAQGARRDGLVRFGGALSGFFGGLSGTRPMRGEVRTPPGA